MDKLELNLDIRTFMIFLYHKFIYLVIFILIGISFGVFSYYKTSKVYTSNAVVSIGKLDSFDMDGGGKDKKINNELFILKTYDFLRKIANETGSNVRYYETILYINEYLNFYKEVDKREPIHITDIQGEYFLEPRKIFFEIKENREILFPLQSIEGNTIFFEKNSSLKFQILNMKPGKYFFTVDPIKETINGIQSRIVINKTVKDSNIINIEYKDFVEERALDFLRLYLDIYFEEYTKRTNSELEDKLNYLTKQKEELNKEVVDSMNKIAEFQENENLVAPKIVAQTETQLLISNQEKLFETKVDLIQLEKVLDLTKKDKFSSVVTFSIYTHNDITNLIQQLITMKNERDMLLVDYTEKHPSVVAKNDGIYSLKKEIQNLIERKIENNKIIINGLNQNIKEKTEKLKSIPKNELILNSLQKKMELNDKLLLAITEKEVAINMDKKKSTGDFTIIENPRIVGYPNKITSPSIYIKPVAFAIFLSLLFAGIFYYREKTIYSVYQISDAIKLKKYFLFKNSIVRNIEEFKNIFYFILSDSKEKQTFFVISDMEKLSLKIALFIAKFSMKKTILIYLDSSKGNIQALFHSNQLNYSFFENIELDYISESIFRKDEEPDLSRNDFIDIQKLKELLYKEFDNIIIHTADEFHYMSQDDIILLNVEHKETKKTFVKEFIDYYHKKDLDHVYMTYLIDGKNEDKSKYIPEQEEEIDVESLLAEKFNTSENEDFDRVRRILSNHKNTIELLKNRLRLSIQEIKTDEKNIRNDLLLANLDGLSSLTEKNIEEMDMTLEFIKKYEKYLGVLDEDN